MKQLVILGATLVSLSLVGCNTMRGMGQDVERGGEKMQSGASNVQHGKSSSSDTMRRNPNAPATSTTAPEPSSDNYPNGPSAR